uniref:DUF5680 domain-containing protein n=1 Tax=Caenorhabditis tropicalis TaxID=1561998 RepID=A0A1I7SXJ5_9PELO
MNVRHKYAHNGGWLFENAEELMIDDNFPEIPLGQIGGINGWFLTMKEDFKNSNFYYYAYIETTNEKPRLKCDYYFNICKNNGSAVFPNKGSCYLNSDQVPEGKPIMDDEWLKEENKYLMNGGIMIEYGFQNEGVLNEDDIWTFNFHDRLFECEEKRNMITFLDNKPFYSHKQVSPRVIEVVLRNLR